LRLEARVTLWLLVLLGAAAAVTLFGIGWFQSKAVGRDAQETAKLLAQSTEASLEVGMVNNSPEDIQGVVANVQKSPLIDQVAVFRRDGTAWVSADVGYTPSAQEQEVLDETLSGGSTGISNVGDTLTVFIPVANKPECGRCHTTDGSILGAVGVTVDEAPLRHELSQATRYSFLFSLAPLLIGLLGALWAVRRFVLRPLAIMGNAAEKLAAGDLSTRVPTLSGWEFDSVGTAMNEMAAKLERRAKNLARTVEQLRFDLEGLEELQALIASGASLREVLHGTAEHLGATMAASGVSIWRVGEPGYDAEWGLGVPPVGEMDLAEDGATVSSAGPLLDVAEEVELSWAAVPAVRDDKTLAVVGVAWNPPRSLLRGERELLGSLANLVAVAVENTLLLDRLKGQEESLEGLIRKTLNTQEEERRRVARELHDETSQVLHGVMMNIEFLETQAVDSGNEDLVARLEAVKALAEQAGKNLDKVMFDLRPALLDELGLVAALRWSLAQARDAFGVDIEFEPAEIGRMSEVMEMVAFRIVQEAVSNCVKHAEAQHTSVDLRVEDDELRIEVKDDGVGFDANEAAVRGRTGEAAGLLGMRERAELLGGRLVVTSVKGSGTTVLAEIPLRASDSVGSGHE
jgi:signal transduction histidine kinase